MGVFSDSDPDADFKTLERLSAFMREAELSELELERKGLRVRLCRGGASQAQAVHAVPMSSAAGSADMDAAAAADAEADIQVIRSPLVGAFYRSPSPDAAHYVAVGDRVGHDKVVCIVEAMKVMNEVQAELEGELVEVLVEDGASVEYNQPLFKVRVA